MQERSLVLAPDHDRARRPLLFVILLVLPWLSPFTLGPTASVVPLLVSWACAALLLFTGSRSQAPGSMLRPLGGLALLLAAVALWPSTALPGADAVALVMSLLAILACALLWLRCRIRAPVCSNCC